MRRFISIAAAIALALALLAGAGFFTLFHTPPGRAFVISLIEPALGGALGGEAKIGAVEGALPNHAVFRNVRIAGDEGDWLRIDRITLDWSALALIRDKINIERLDIAGVHMLAAPPQGAGKDEISEPNLPRLPEALPNLVIRIFSITGVEVAEEAFGRPLRLDGAGALAMHGRALSAAFEANSADAFDFISARIDLDPKTGRGFVDLTIASQADGFISALAGVDGRLYVEAHGDAPLADFSMKVDGEIGAYGSAELTLNGDLIRAKSLHADAKLSLGEKLDDVAQELGEHVEFSAVLSQDGGTILAHIERFESAAGRATGDIEWRAGADSLQSASARLQAAFAESYQPDVQAILGSEATLDAKLLRVESAYRLDAELVGPKARLVLEDARTDLDTRLVGLATLALFPRDDLPAPLRAGATAMGALTLAEGEIPRLEELHIETPDGSSFDGEVRFDFDREALALGGEASISPAMLALLSPGAHIGEPVKATLSASGALAALAGEIGLDAPSIALNGGTMPAATATIAFVRKEPELAADITARAKEKEGRLEARIVLDGDKISLTAFSLAGERFTLEGSGVYHAKAEAADVGFTYKGGAGAEPWPGTPLAGSLAVEGSVGRKGDANDLAVTAENLVLENISIGALAARASGPSNALSLDAQAQNLILPGIGPAKRLDLAGRADLGAAASLALARLDLFTNAIEGHLTAPARFSFAEGVTIEAFRASVNQSGSIALDGAFSDRRWRASLALKETPVPGADVIISADLDLDTDREAVARGDFVARSELVDMPASDIRGAIAWDGSALHITNADAKDGVDIDIRLPLLLTRSPRLSAAFEGEMSGRVDYEGRVEAIAPYLPPTLQSLEGALRIAAAVGGTLEEPQIAGKLSVENGAYTELASGLSLEGIKGEATASAAKGATLLAFDFSAYGHAQTSQTISFAGKATLGEGGRLDAVLKADGARFAAGPVKSAVASGEIALKGPLDSISAEGALQVGALDAEIVTPSADGLVGITVTPIGAAAKEAVVPERPPAPPLLLDITISADDKLFMRGRGLESEWRADMRATGDAADPLLIGSVNLRRGTLDFSGRRFNLTRGAIAFDRLSRNNPILDIRAEYETSDGVLAAIEVTGRADAPSVTLVSTPSLPTNDIMALVLFGKPATELSALESLQVAQALAQLGGIGPFGAGGGVTSAARRALGLDLLTVDIGAEAGASTLQIGKYLAHGLFVSATQDVRGENGAVRVEYEITKSISVETELQQNGDQTVSANWKRDF